MSQFKKEDIDKILDDAEEKERDAEIENLFDDIFDKGKQKQSETEQSETEQSKKQDETNNEEIIEIPCDDLSVDSSDDSSDEIFNEVQDNEQDNEQNNEQESEQESNVQLNEQNNEQESEQGIEQEFSEQNNEQNNEQDIEQESEQNNEQDNEQNNEQDNEQGIEPKIVEVLKQDIDQQSDETPNEMIIKIEATDDAKDEVRDDVQDDAKDEVRDDVQDEAQDEVRDDIQDEAQDEAKDEVRDQVRDEVRDEVRDQPRDQERVIEVETTNEQFDVNKANELRDKVFKDIKTDYLNLSYDPLNVNMELIDENKNQYYKYILSGLLIPTTQLGRTLHINNFIRDITSYSSFDCFASPNLSFEYSPAERIYIMTRLNTLFDFQFMNVTNLDNITFENISSNISKFLSNYSNQQSIKIEHQIIKAFINKVIIALNTEEELAFRDNSIRIDKQFQLAIANDLREIKSILNTDQNNKITKSWNVFIEAFLSLGNEVQIFKFKDYADLNNKLRTANKTDFLYENLLGNMLKTYLPSIAYNYFSIIKIMYMLARFIGVYISNKIYSNRRSEEIARDLKLIAASCVITYENKNYIFKQMARTLPRYSKPLSEQGQMYITNHMIVGGQYYLLKYVEESISIIELLLR